MEKTLFMMLMMTECCYNCQHNENRFQSEYDVECEFHPELMKCADFVCNEHEIADEYEEKLNS